MASFSATAASEVKGTRSFYGQINVGVPFILQSKIKGNKMAVGLVANAIYVNQQTPSVASVATAHNNRVDFQNMVAQTTAQEKEIEVLEVRPSEENHEVNPDREHEKNEADQENARNKKHKKTEEEKEIQPPLHILDIKV